MRPAVLTRGFTLIELLIAMSIMAILSTIIYANFTDARKIARDDIRKTSLKEMQLAIELYRAQNGEYPDQGCGSVGSQWAGHAPQSGNFRSCPSTFVSGLAPNYIEALATDPNPNITAGTGFYYQTNNDNSAYKLLVHNSVESITISSYADEFARCPRQCGSCGSGTPPANQYAVYSIGAECW